MAELLIACDVAVFGEPDTTLEDVRDDWGAPHFDLERDAWLVRGPDAAAAGYAWIRVRVPGSEFDADFFVRPKESVRAVGESLLTAIESRSRERATPADDATPPLVSVLCPSADPAKRGLLERADYAPIRSYFRMEIRFAESPHGVSRGPAPVAPRVLPRGRSHAADGVEIRPFRLGMDDRAVHAAVEESFAEHFRFVPRPFEEWWALRTAHERFDPALWLLAWDGDRVAGALVAYDFGDIGFVRELGVRKPWRGRGVGTALLLRSFEDFERRGQRRIVLGVDAENENAIGLYRRIGMWVDRRYDLYQKSVA